MAAITTICIVGFPPEALPRELKNLCRFVPGFEGAHVAFTGQGQASALFVKFQTLELAAATIEAVHGQVFDVDSPQVTLKAEFARREMEVRAASALPAPLVTSAPPWHADRAVARPAPVPVAAAALPAGQAYGGAGRQKVGTTGGELVTITVLGLRDKGWRQEDLQAWFQQRPGFTTLHMNERVDGLFVKFSSSHAAEQAMQEANAMNFGAEWARRNLDDDLGARPPAAPQASYPVAAAAPAPLLAAPAGAYGGGYGAPKRGPAEELTTITVLGIKAKGLTEEELERWFQQRHGFVSFHFNDRIGGVFVKFATGASAEQAMQDANNMQWGAEWARRNLDDDLATKTPAPAPIQAAPAGGYANYGGPPKRLRTSTPGELDTITILGIAEKEQRHGSLQGWCQERPGFVALQLNERVDGLFVKFSSPVLAEQAIQDANAQQFGAEWARRNLDL